MKKVFLGLIAATMLMACHQNVPSTTQAEIDAQAAKQTPTTTAPTTAAAVASTNAPVIKFEKDNFNFGKIKQGDKVSYDFKFTNTGKSPLIITDATATCGCTKPEWPKEPVQPGADGIIKVTFNSMGKSGLQDKMITVSANTVPAQSMVHLVGEVLVK